ncbi:TetR/AcrR family transcriptional regulator [Streptacidiphilus sp. N1-3]|uniref:TetR/AcrR family transcriptional regulator n=1 Tax=Streptacidiphilus alkalitolerans TaxID=3342712 RepID=A0ABV6WX98_9ACTN
MWPPTHRLVGSPPTVCRARGARERILGASKELFREQGINRTGMDQLCAEAQASKRTAYQHFANKGELVTEYLRRFDPSVLPNAFDRTDLTPRERLLAARILAKGRRAWNPSRPGPDSPDDTDPPSITGDFHTLAEDGGRTLDGASRTLVHRPSAGTLGPSPAFLLRTGERPGAWRCTAHECPISLGVRTRPRAQLSPFGPQPSRHGPARGATPPVPHRHTTVT